MKALTLAVVALAAAGALSSAPSVARADDHPVDTISQPHAPASDRVPLKPFKRAARHLRCTPSSYVWYLDDGNPDHYATGVWLTASADGFLAAAAGPTSALDCTTRVSGRRTTYTIVRTANRRQAREFDHFLRYMWCYDADPCYYLRRGQMFVMAQQFTWRAPALAAARRLAPLGYVSHDLA